MVNRVLAVALVLMISCCSVVVAVVLVAFAVF